jgi:hypothetical protein
MRSIPVLLAFCAIGLSQTPQSVIHISKTELIQGLPTGSVLNYPKCDESKNVYVRYFSSPTANTNPVIRIPSDGSAYSTLDFAKLSDSDAANALRNARIYDFAVSGSNVYIASVDEAGKPRVVVFDSDGKFKGVVPIENDIHPAKLSIFSTGEILILGTKADKGSAGSTSTDRQSMIGLFDRNGKFIKEVKLKSQDLKISNKAKPEEKTRSVDLALMEAGPGGTVYLLPYGTSRTLYLISASGEVDRSFTLATTDKAFMPLSMRVGATQVLVEYVKDKQSYEYDLYNAQTGEHQQTYSLDKEPMGIFACYDWRGTFAFLGTNASGERVFRYAMAP